MKEKAFFKIVEVEVRDFARRLWEKGYVTIGEAATIEGAVRSLFVLKFDPTNNPKNKKKVE